MKRMPWFPFYPEQFVADTQNLSGCEVGPYMLALCWAWKQGSLPADEEECFEIMKIRGANPQKILHKVLRLFFVRNGDVWLNRKMETIRTEQAAKLLRRKEASRIANDKRWGALRAAKAAGTEATFLKNQHDARLAERTKHESSDSDSQRNPKREVVHNPSSPSQARESPPARFPGGLGRTVRHTAPLRQAAKRHSAAGRAQAPQAGVSPMQAPATQPRARASHVTTPSREPSDPRFTPLAAHITGPFWRELNRLSEDEAKQRPCAWSNQDKAALSRMLASCDRSESDLQGMLGNYALSVAAGEFSATDAPRFWLEKLPRFEGGPLNRFMSPPPKSKVAAPDLGFIHRDTPAVAVSEAEQQWDVAYERELGRVLEWRKGEMRAGRTPEGTAGDHMEYWREQNPRP